MSSDAKLTKKQKKALAFRERKTKGKSTADEETSNDLPEHDLLPDDDEVHEPQPESSSSRKQLETPSDEKVSKKRKREKEQQETTSAPEVPTSEPAAAKPPKKKSKTSEESGEKPGPEKRRYILFLGNLKYTTSMDAIKAHFAKCDPPPNIRLLTPKATAGKPTIKSKGCAFLEFSHRNALQQGLKLHHSELDGRIINVELTAGGGGKGESRLKKLTERNKDLTSQRKKQQAKSKDGGEAKATVSPKAERYSSTSGAEHTPSNKRTWTVGETTGDDQTHRGGQKHLKPSKKRTRAQVTGMNAIPLGTK